MTWAQGQAAEAIRLWDEGQPPLARPPPSTTRLCSKRRPAPRRFRSRRSQLQRQRRRQGRGQDRQRRRGRREKPRISARTPAQRSLGCLGNQRGRKDQGDRAERRADLDRPSRLIRDIVG
ncbi:hypothetical protein [Saccharopolyspora phatthalungensis]|uniref:hypothetical protein n=1 Tax=Saccharopolyspora phatthalungensis TaxID=664693 RepID=UPI0035E4449E